MYNPNLISDEYAGRFVEAEIEAVALLSQMIGYDPGGAGGVFTFGGTGTNLYGCKIGIEKQFQGQGMLLGIREDVKIVSSEAAHYSKLNVAAWLGLGTGNLVTLPVSSRNDLSIPALEAYLRSALEKKEKVAVILTTMGSTDAFGIDDLEAVFELRERLTREYGLESPPHIHADAVIGWSWIAFKDYDFAQNPLGFHSRTLRSIGQSLARIKNLHLADSLGIDFHKTGYAPYVSSLFLIKDRRELTLLSRHPEQMPYLYQFGHYNPGIYTLECSRSGTSALAALANLKLFGKQGYRVLIGHVVEMAEMLRERLEGYPFIKVLNDYNYGPVTLFRVYPGPSADEAFERELTDRSYGAELIKNNQYNRDIFASTHEQAMKGEGVLLSWTDAYQHSRTSEALPISAIKSYIMSPWTDLPAVDKVIEQVLSARGKMS
jgi:glutamate/tyrosine decarboxylase-like PLP-dependent enzyme